MIKLVILFICIVFFLSPPHLLPREILPSVWQDQVQLMTSSCICFHHLSLLVKTRVEVRDYFPYMFCSIETTWGRSLMVATAFHCGAQ